MVKRKDLTRRASALLTLILLATVLVTVAGAHAASPIDYNVTTPRDFLGYDIGQDYKLTPWQTHELVGEGLRKGIVEYAHELERTSNRVHVFQYGTTEMGRPMILTVITSPENWAQMDNLKGILHKLADPRQVATDDEAKWLANQGKAVYWISAGIHSTERTSGEVLLRLGYDLASGNDDWTLRLLDNVIVVLENSINPDGLDMVTDWYYQYKDTPYASSTPPYYGKYVNHDDNRDFLGLALAESQNNVEGRAEWNPTVYHDLHEAMDMLYMSPGPDPTNEAVNPITNAEWLAFAGHNIGQLIAQGWQGVFTYDYADMWYPGYNHGYSFMHNTNGRFYELQGARLATPRDFTRPGRVRSWFNPLPYTVPFTWHLLDAVNLEEDALRNDLTYTARNKDMLLYNFYVKGKTNMQKAMGTAPFAFVIPAGGGDNADVTDMVNNLHLGQHIEVDRAGTAFTAGGQQFAAGDYVVRMDQPLGLTAKNLLSVQSYPPIKTPYDVTAWTYGLMRDVQVMPLTMTLPAGLSLVPVTEEVPYAGTLTGDVSSRYVIENGSNNNLAVALPRLWDDPDVMVAQADSPFMAGERGFPAGTLILRTSGTQADHDTLAALVEELGLVAYSISERVSGIRLAAPMVGLYTANTSTNTTMPEGWTRLRLDRAGWDYTRLYASDVLSGTLDGYDVVIVPSMPTSTLINGTSSSSTPPEYRLGIGAEGVAKLKSFVEAGGTLVLQGRVSTLPIEQGWDIGVQLPPTAAAIVRAQAAAEPENPEDIPDFGGPQPGTPQAAAMAAAAETLNCPGSILRIQVDPTTKVGYGYDSAEALWCESGLPFFQLQDGSQASVVASYPDDGQPLLLSGYLSGESVLRGQAAIVDAPLGKGHVILLAPNVLYRAQATGSFMFFWNSLLEGSREGPAESWRYLPLVGRRSAGGGQ
jgi:hypothetical protein